MRWRYIKAKPGSKRQVWRFAFTPTLVEANQTGVKYWVWLQKYLVDERYNYCFIRGKYTWEPTEKRILD